MMCVEIAKVFLAVVGAGPKISDFKKCGDRSYSSLLSRHQFGWLDCFFWA